jgi:hypothetical protein
MLRAVYFYYDSFARNKEVYNKISYIFLPVYRFYKAFTAFFCLLSKGKIIFQLIFGHKKQDAEYDIL